MAALAFTAAACDSVTGAAGRAVDASGRPVVGALVVLKHEGTPADSSESFSRTDSAGRFDALLHGGYGPPDAVLAICGSGRSRAQLASPVARGAAI
ncbi:carboxypeptidase-like regulatory domain-containing protein [Roseisolibacter sp. H3M3-2]|uniref:carboxypeptidase-like regulatory domain-containing protein n=1 Tax=Roseisolibacter sp. H3M3-2 TaxID=3031323 RepID=UPI0023DB3CD7|nr:carboxypeptidase-like regulatory domain-containing protein [Roseisolibacter sp. H3M3-2]MDF1501798.1 carboxypeptidase-like regulatory domain-containing protein [Roseisolibacter sp. H3M3-2]